MKSSIRMGRLALRTSSEKAYDLLDKIDRVFSKTC